MAEPTSKRFGALTKEEIDQKRVRSTPKNTLKANRKAAKIFRQYLSEQTESSMTESGAGQSLLDFESFSVQKLNELLKQFYFNARTTSGKKYKVTSLENFRHSLNRYLKTPPVSRDIDIIKDAEFSTSNESYRAALNELKSEGLGVVDHHPLIAPSDLTKIYQGFDTDSPRGLLKKVQFDIRFYFFRTCRRGPDKMQSMTKETFAIKKFPDSGLKYVCKAIECENQREMDIGNYSGFMTQDPSNDKCPVKSFEKLLSHLHPACNSLWQRPRENPTEHEIVWYYNRSVGKDSLSQFMRQLSIQLNLSHIYTNYSIRITAASILGQYKFSPRQMMSATVTGDNSVNSLPTYQMGSEKEKVEMGNVLQTTFTKQISFVAAPEPEDEVENEASIGLPEVQEFSNVNMATVKMPSKDPAPSLPQFSLPWLSQTESQTQKSPAFEDIDYDDLDNLLATLTNTSQTLPLVGGRSSKSSPDTVEAIYNGKSSKKRANTEPPARKSKRKQLQRLGQSSDGHLHDSEHNQNTNDDSAAEEPSLTGENHTPLSSDTDPLKCWFYSKAAMDNYKYKLEVFEKHVKKARMGRHNAKQDLEYVQRKKGQEFSNGEPGFVISESTSISEEEYFNNADFESVDRSPAIKQEQYTETEANEQVLNIEPIRSGSENIYIFKAESDNSDEERGNQKHCETQTEIKNADIEYLIMACAKLRKENVELKAKLDSVLKKDIQKRCESYVKILPVTVVHKP